MTMPCVTTPSLEAHGWADSQGGVGQDGTLGCAAWTFIFRLPRAIPRGSLTPCLEVSFSFTIMDLQLTGLQLVIFTIISVIILQYIFSRIKILGNKTFIPPNDWLQGMMSIPPIGYFLAIFQNGNVGYGFTSISFLVQLLFGHNHLL